MKRPAADLYYQPQAEPQYLFSIAGPEAFLNPHSAAPNKNMQESHFPTRPEFYIQVTSFYHVFQKTIKQ
jgi:hypothetical protein